jgi:hypothetical protein
MTVVESNSEKEVEVRIRTEEPEFLQFTRYACVNFFFHKTENKSRSKNKRFLLFKCTETLLKTKKNIHTELEIEKYCRIGVSFQNSGDNLTLFKTIHSHTESRSL